MRRACKVVMALGLTIAVLAIGTRPADATSTMGQNRVTFGGVDGEPSEVRAIGDQVWVGGEFTTAYDADLTTSYTRTNFAVFDFNSGDVLPLALDPDGQVESIVTDYASTVWMGGGFNEIDGQVRYNIAAVDVFTGELISGFAASTNDDVNALLLHDGWLYVGGEFTIFNGEDMPHLVRVDPATGALDLTFTPNPNGDVRALDAWQDRLYAVGKFDEVGQPGSEVTRRWVAGLDAATGAPAGPQFYLPPLGPGENIWKARADAVLVSDDGNWLYTGDGRNDVTKWNRLTGQELWDQGAEGDIQAIGIDATSVYVGFHDGWDSKFDGRLIAAVDRDTGARDTTWTPTMDGQPGVLGIDVAQGALLAVGEFTLVNEVPSPGIAVFHSPDWDGADPLVPPPPATGDVNCDASVGVADALLILQYDVGIRTGTTACPIDPITEIHLPSGDVDGDGDVDFADALFILQCDVGIPNPFCPSP